MPVLNVKNILPAEPFFIAEVVHLIADPGRGEHLRVGFRPFLLLRLRLQHAGLQPDGVHADQGSGGYLHIIRVFVP